MVTDREVIKDLEEGYNVSLIEKREKRIERKLKEKYPNRKLIKLKNYRDTYYLE